MNIYVLIATIDEGIHRVPSILLPEQEGVRYVVSWQRRPTPSPSRDGGELLEHYQRAIRVILLSY